MAESAGPERGAVEFWYEFASTYSYPAAMRAESAAAAHGLRVVWRPFLLGPIFAQLGWSTSPFNLQPAKGAYMWRDMQRICGALGLSFHKPDRFPQNGLLAARIATSLADGPHRAAFSRAVYLHQFTERGDIADRSALAAILASMGQDPEAVFAQADTAQTKAALRATTERAVLYGIFGAPTWRTADSEIFWGNDRLETALNWAASLRR